MTFYRPHAETPSTIKANKVLCLVEKETFSTEKGAGRMLKDLMGTVANKRGKIQLFPVMWPDSATTALQNVMKEIVGKINTEIKDGMTPTQMILKCQAIAEQKAMDAPYFFQHVLRQETVDHVRELNSRGGYKGKLWQIDHLTQPWQAGKVPFQVGDTVLDPESLIKMWAYARVACKSAAGRVRPST